MKSLRPQKSVNLTLRRPKPKKPAPAMTPLRAFVDEHGTVWLEVWTLGADVEERLDPGELVFRSREAAELAAKRVRLKGWWAATTLVELLQTKKERIQWTK